MTAWLWFAGHNLLTVAVVLMVTGLAGRLPRVRNAGAAFCGTGLLADAGAMAGHHSWIWMGLDLIGVMASASLLALAFRRRVTQ